MYGRGSDGLPAVVTTASATAVLPYTAGNTTATVLAFIAIALGVAILFSQIIVRVLRRKYSK